MASPCSITIDTRNEGAAQHAADLAVTEVRRIEHKYSRYQPDSVVSRINRDAVRKPPWRWMRKRLGCWTLPSVCGNSVVVALTSAPGYCGGPGIFAANRSPLPRCCEPRWRVWAGPSSVGTGRRFVLARQGMEIDFGGIGKEYAADRAAHLLRQQGVENALVNLGGDIHARGAARARRWLAGPVEHHHSPPPCRGRVRCPSALAPRGAGDQWRLRAVFSRMTGAVIATFSIPATVCL
jgi:thiamine biosynthesis lipoprotein